MSKFEDNYLEELYQSALVNIENGNQYQLKDNEIAKIYFSTALNRLLSALNFYERVKYVNPNFEDKIILNINLCFLKFDLISYNSDYLYYLRNKYLNNYLVNTDKNNAKIKLKFRNNLKEILQLVQIESGDKLKRIKASEELKILKWLLNFRCKELKYQLKSQMLLSMHPKAVNYLFDKNFRSNLKAIKSLKHNLLNERENVFNNLDLILQWCSLKLSDSNQLLILTIFDFLIYLFKVMKSYKYTLIDYEFNSLIPYLIKRFADHRPIITKTIHYILTLIYDLYDHKTFFNYLILCLDYKDWKIKTELMNHISYLIFNFRIDLVNLNDLIKKLMYNLKNEHNEHVFESTFKVLILLKKLDYNQVKLLVEPVYLNQISNKVNKIDDLNEFKLSELTSLISNFKSYLIKDLNEFDKVVDSILDKNIDVSILNCLLVQTLFRQKDKLEFLQNYSDKILSTCIDRLKNTLLIESKSIDSYFIFELVNHLLNLINDLFWSSNAKKSLNKQIYKKMFIEFIELIICQENSLLDVTMKEMLRYNLLKFMNLYDDTKSFCVLFELTADLHARNNNIDLNYSKDELNNNFLNVFLDVFKYKNSNFFKYTKANEINDLLNIKEILHEFNRILNLYPISTWPSDSSLLNCLIEFLFELIRKRSSNILIDLSDLEKVVMNVNQELILIIHDCLDGILKYEAKLI